MKRTHDVLAEVVELLSALLDSSERKARIKALRMLALAGEAAEPVIPKLLTLLDDTSGHYRQWAITALGAIGPKAARAVPPLLEVLQGKKPGPDLAPQFAASALGEIGCLEALPALVQAAKIADPAGPGANAIKALGEFGGKAAAAVPVLNGMLTQSRYRHNLDLLIKTLGRIGPPAAPATPTLKAMLADKKYAGVHPRIHGALKSILEEGQYEDSIFLDF